MIYAEKYVEVEREIRKIVDELMRHELEQLQVSICMINNIVSTFFNLFVGSFGSGSCCQRQKSQKK